MNNISRTFQFESEVDKHIIDCMEIKPSDKIKGIVQIVHGMCEHKERYIEFMNYLADKGLLCIIHDHRGHGKSVSDNSEFGYFDKGGWQALFRDTRQLTGIMKKRYPNVPYFLIGHSMGSLVARGFLKRFDYEIDKLILLGSPSKMPGMKIGKLLTRILILIKGEKSRSHLADKLIVDLRYEAKFKGEGDHAWICSDPSVIDVYKKDPLCNFRFTLQGYEQLIKLTIDIYSKKNWDVTKPDIPILFLSGEDDPCALSPEKFKEAQNLLKSIGYNNVEGRMIKGMRHEILNEPGRKKIYDMIYKFIMHDI